MDYAHESASVVVQHIGIGAPCESEKSKGGILQAYVRASASSAMLCSVHVLRVFVCIFCIEKGSDTYQNGLGYISDTYPNPYPLSRYPPYDYSKRAVCSHPVIRNF